MKELLSLLNFDTKTQDGITNITVWLAMLVYFLFINLFVLPVAVPRQPADYTLYLFVLFVPGAVKLIFFSGDPISFKKNTEGTFFQAQLPDAYIASKFNIPRPLAQHLWFRALDKRVAEGEIKRTYQYGFTCRLVYYVRRVTGAFALLSALFLLAGLGHHYWQNYRCGWAGLAGVWGSFLAIVGLRGKVFYFLNLVAVFLYLTVENKPRRKEPTGVWARWKHINDRSKAWVDKFGSLQEFQLFVGDDPTPERPTERQA